jgi:hypothetical protein
LLNKIKKKKGTVCIEECVSHKCVVERKEDGPVGSWQDVASQIPLPEIYPDARFKQVERQGVGGCSSFSCTPPPVLWRGFRGVLIASNFAVCFDGGVEYYTIAGCTQLSSRNLLFPKI